METSRLWRETVTASTDVDFEHQLVDSIAMLLLTKPTAYDVVVTENLFGDILTDRGRRARRIRSTCCRRRLSAGAPAC